MTTRGPLFEGATEQEAARLLERARRRRFDAGEVVFHAGDPADTLHLIQSGRFAARVTTEFGDIATLTCSDPARCSASWRCSPARAAQRDRGGAGGRGRPARCTGSTSGACAPHTRRQPRC